MILMLECRRTRDTAAMLAPAMVIKLPVVWRRSWNLSGRTFALGHSFGPGAKCSGHRRRARLVRGPFDVLAAGATTHVGIAGDDAGPAHGAAEDAVQLHVFQHGLPSSPMRGGNQGPGVCRRYGMAREAEGRTE